MPKSTEELYHELLAASHIGDYLQHNQQELTAPELHLYLQALLREKNKRRSEVIRAANLESSYGYRLFDGSKKHPHRDKLIALASGLQLDQAETSRLLKYAGHRELYPRDRRDSIISFCLDKGYDLDAINQTLSKFCCAELDLMKEDK